MHNKFNFVFNSFADLSAIPPIINQPPYVFTRSACLHLTLSSMFGWFIFAPCGFLILFFRGLQDLRTRWNFRISPDCWKDSTRQLKADLYSWKRLINQSAGSWHMFYNYKMLDPVCLKQLAGSIPQSWFSQISYRFPSRVVQRFLQIFFFYFFCLSKALLTQTQDAWQINAAGSCFSLDSNKNLHSLLERTLYEFILLLHGTIYYINVRCRFCRVHVIWLEKPHRVVKRLRHPLMVI